MKQFRITYQITDRDQDSLNKYLNDIAKLPMINHNEEKKLAREIRKGSEGALEKLIMANLRFVVSVAKQYQHMGLALADLINEGNLGLMKAASKFDSSKGFKFISYAVWWIRQSIMQSIVKKAKLVRLPINKVASYKKLYEIAKEFEQKHQRQPNLEELSALTGLTKRMVKDMQSRNTRHVSIDAPIEGGEEETNSMADLMEDTKEKAPDLTLIKESLDSEISDILNVLPAREADILTLYFGLNGVTRHNLEEIGEKYELTRERVRQIKDRALRRLRKAANGKSLKNYLE